MSPGRVVLGPAVPPDSWSYRTTCLGHLVLGPARYILGRHLVSILAQLDHILHRKNKTLKVRGKLTNF